MDHSAVSNVLKRAEICIEAKGGNFQQRICDILVLVEKS
jgi:hypothetical protein